MVGKLQYAASILPAAKSLFTPLYRAQRGDPTFVTFGKGSEVRDALLDFTPLLKSLSSRPTHVAELVHRDDDYIGFCDASAFGAGGVWFGGAKPLDPVVWRVVFPKDITEAVVSDSNPKGRLTNSDLEMAGVLLHQLVLERLVPMRHCRSVIHCDNTPAVSWSTRMTCRAESRVAPQLLRGLAMRQRTLRSMPATVISIAGEDNTLADVSSRKVQPTPVSRPTSVFPLLPDDQFLTYFDQRFPLPQNSSWTRVNPSSKMQSQVISTLRGRQLHLRQWTTPPELLPGGTGSATLPNAASIPTSSLSPAASNSMPSWALPLGLELASTARTSKLVSKPSKTPYVSWHKPSCWLDSTTREGPTDPKS